MSTAVDLAPTAPIDALLGRENIYQVDPESAAAQRLDLLRRAVAAHRAGNRNYDGYCRRVGFDEAHLGNEDDLARVPLLPSAIFKRNLAEVATDAAGPLLATTSSGTQGTISTVPRCDVTLMRFFASVAAGNREILGHERLDRPVLHIGPTTAEEPDLWIAYVMAGVGVIMPSRSYMSASSVDLNRLEGDLRACGTATLIGPPALLSDLAGHLLSRAKRSAGLLHLGSQCQVVSIGGWKRRSGEAMEKPAFRARMVEALGLAGPEQVRDSYNMVELNSVFFECANHALHVPPWVSATARDPRTLKGVPDNIVGLLAFLDPTPASYPGFVLSDDFGTVNRRVHCPCGISGDVITVMRRVNRVEARGCALKLDTPVTGPGQPSPGGSDDQQ